MAFPWRSVPPHEFQIDLRRVKRLARFLDAEYKVFGFPVGWDPIIGLIPVVGDTVSMALGVYPILVAHKHDLGWDFKGYMALNLAIDWAIGLIPFVDVVLDTIYKSNLMNAILLEKAYEKRHGRKLSEEIAPTEPPAS